MLIATLPKLKALCQSLSQVSQIGLDTEFIREKTYYPELALIQVAYGDQAVLIDPLAFSPQELRPFLEILTVPEIAKIMHAAQGDQECLLTAYQTLATPLFDTGEAAGLCGLGDHPGLAWLVDKVLGVQLRKGSARSHWLQRPLPAELMEYALEDVRYLIPLANQIMSRLKKQGRLDWAWQLSRQWEEKDRYLLQPEKMVAGLLPSSGLHPRAYGALLELVKWRESRAQSLNIPRRRVAEHATLLALAKVRPKTPEHLSSFRGLSAGEIKKSGDFLLKLFRRVNALAEHELPSFPQQPKLSSSQKRLVQYLKFALSPYADRAKVSLNQLVSTESLAAILQANGLQPEEWVVKGYLTPVAYDLIGAALWSLLQGERALVIQSGDLVVVSLSPAKNK